MFRSRRYCNEATGGRTLAGEYFQSHSTVGQIVDDVDQVTQVPTEPVQLPHDQCVPSPHSFQTGCQLWPIILLARRLIFVNLLRINPGSKQCVPLQVRCLRPVSF